VTQLVSLPTDTNRLLFDPQALLSQGYQK